jgi:hypothetical protein
MAAVTFDVERVVKGAFGAKAIVRTNAQGSACGLEQLDTPQTVVLLRMGPDGVWESDLCSMLTPSALLAVGGAHAPDPGIPAVSAGWNSLWMFLAIGVLAVALGMVALWSYARRHVSSPDTSGVA